jgi:predicted  nucleic acid-binding Zn-ribbon protein
MKTLDQQESEKKKRLETVANHKEYQSIKTEIDQLKKEQHELEDGLMSAWNQLETVKKEYESALKAYEEQQTKVHNQLEENNKKIADLKRQVDGSIMRAKVSDPVVPVVEGNCTACFYKVSAQDMQFLKRRKLVQCKDCYRLLYLPEAHQSDGTQNQDQA